MNSQQKRTILVVDDLASNVKIIHRGLKNQYRIVMARSGKEALDWVADNPLPDIVLLDVMMPEINGYEVMKRLQDNPVTKSIPVIFLTALSDEDAETKGFNAGAVDYITKPISLPVVKARIKNHLELKEYRERLEMLVKERTAELQSAHKMIKEGYIETIYRLTLSAEFKDEDTGEHIKRVSMYSREIATGLGMDAGFTDRIYHASPMHDVGKVGIPDSILLKPGKLTSEEWKTMQDHTTIGARILQGSTSPYLHMAQDIALYHHEKWNGKGYPHGIQGEEIPLAARIMNIVDQYDALRSKRPYKKAFDHQSVVEIITLGDGRTIPEDFDPEVLRVFKDRSVQLEEIFEEHQ